MPWFLVDVLIGALALAVLAAVCFVGYLHVKRLLRTAKAAGKRVAVVTGEINELQRQGTGHRTP